MYFIPFALTILVLIFESITDIITMKTYTLPIYLTCIINIAIKTLCYIQQERYECIIYMYLFIILFGVCCYSLSYLLHNKLGAGDFDVMFLIFITQPFLAIILIISAIAMFIKQSFRKNIPMDLRDCKNVSKGRAVFHNLCAIKISLVPFLFAVYIISIILTGVIK